MASIDDFVTKKNSSYVEKKQMIEGSFSCSECNLYAEFAMIDESMSMEWECEQGHKSYGRL
jgi:hypothetical protein